MGAEALAIEAGAAAAQTAAQMATAKWNDKRQLAQEGKLQEQQMANQNKQSQYNQQLALDMWEKTNYAAQREQMEKAGLNVGLMYKQGGPGGTTQGGAPGNVSTGAAPKGGGEIGMGLQLGLQTAMQQATIELTKAQTEKTKAETTKTAGVDTAETQARTGLMGIQMQTEAGKQAVMNWETKIKEIETNVANRTQEDVIDNVRQENLKLIGVVEQESNKAREARETVEQRINQVNTASAEQALRMLAQKAGLKQTEATTKLIFENTVKTITERKQSWTQLNLHERETIVKEELMKLQKTTTEFHTSTPQEIKQWTEILTDVLGTFAPKGYK